MTHVLRHGLSVLAKTWEEKGKVGGQRYYRGSLRFTQGGYLGCDETGGNGSEHTGDTTKWEMAVGRVYGLREDKHGGPTMVSEVLACGAESKR